MCVLSFSTILRYNICCSDECDGVTLKMHAEVLVGLRKKRLSLLSSFNKNCFHMPNFSISVLY